MLLVWARRRHPVRPLWPQRSLAAPPSPLRGSMRPLTEEEMKIFFEKLAKYIGNGIKALVDRPDGRYCFRLHRDRVY